jgi:hypothetical protein
MQLLFHVQISFATIDKEKTIHARANADEARRYRGLDKPAVTNRTRRSPVPTNLLVRITRFKAFSPMKLGHKTHSAATVPPPGIEFAACTDLRGKTRVYRSFQAAAAAIKTMRFSGFWSPRIANIRRKFGKIYGFERRWIEWFECARQRQQAAQCCANSLARVYAGSIGIGVNAPERRKKLRLLPRRRVR